MCIARLFSYSTTFIYVSVTHTFSYVGEDTRNAHIYEGSWEGEHTSNTHVQILEYTCESSEMLLSYVYDSYLLPLHCLHMCTITHAEVCPDLLFIHATWQRAMTHSYLRRDSFIIICPDSFTRVTWLIHTFDMTVCHDSFIHETWRIHIRVPWLDVCDDLFIHFTLPHPHVCDMTYSHIYDITLSYTNDMTHSHIYDMFHSYLFLCQTHTCATWRAYICMTLLIHIWIRW